MDTVDYLTQAVVRLVGDIKGKRVLELGSAGNSLSGRFSSQGAIPTLVEESADKLTKIRASQDANDLRFEVRHSEFADLAFCPAESIDLAVSVISLSGTKDLARVFRQLQRVLKDQGSFVFGLVHPIAFISANSSDTRDSKEVRKYRCKEPMSREDLNGNFPVPLPKEIFPRSLSEIFALLKRVGLSIENLLELPEPTTISDLNYDPSVLLIRARK